MRLVDRRTGVEVMTTAECLQLLATEEIGRLAVAVGGEPHVIPVNYALDGDTIIFQSADGTKLRGARDGSVAFEVDHFERATRSGWSVVVHGRAVEVTSMDRPDDVARASAARPEPWADFAKDHLVRIVPRLITGRRISPLPAEALPPS